MKKFINKNNDKIKDSDFLITCSACGFSFGAIDQKSGTKVKECPMCGHKFLDPNFLPQKPSDFDPKTY
jgi:rRNA maturation endonuclease Nob1